MVYQKEEYARDIWIFLYKCNGINFADLLSMKWSNKHGECLEFYRKKTETTRKTNRKKIMIPLTNDLKSIIEKVGVKDSPFILGKLNDFIKIVLFRLFNKLKKSY